MFHIWHDFKCSNDYMGGGTSIERFLRLSKRNRSASWKIASTLELKFQVKTVRSSLEYEKI